MNHPKSWQDVLVYVAILILIIGLVITQMRGAGEIDAFIFVAFIIAIVYFNDYVRRTDERIKMLEEEMDAHYNKSGKIK